MGFASILLGELDREAISTEQVLLRVPSDKLDWRPHPKSMTLGELAWHIASIPAIAAKIVESLRFDVGSARPPAGRDSNDFIARLRASLAEAHRVIEPYDDEAISKRVELVRGDEVVHTFSRIAAIRTVMLNHSIHHRGQLTVYLRLLDVPLPAIYGSSAEERAF